MALQTASLTALGPFTSAASSSGSVATSCSFPVVGAAIAGSAAVYGCCKRRRVESSPGHDRVTSLESRLARCEERLARAELSIQGKSSVNDLAKVSEDLDLVTSGLADKVEATRMESEFLRLESYLRAKADSKPVMEDIAFLRSSLAGKANIRVEDDYLSLRSAVDTKANTNDVNIKLRQWFSRASAEDSRPMQANTSFSALHKDLQNLETTVEEFSNALRDRASSTGQEITDFKMEVREEVEETFKDIKAALDAAMAGFRAEILADVGKKADVDAVTKWFVGVEKVLDQKLDKIESENKTAAIARCVGDLTQGISDNVSIAAQQIQTLRDDVQMRFGWNTMRFPLEGNLSHPGCGVPVPQNYHLEPIQVGDD